MRTRTHLGELLKWRIAPEMPTWRAGRIQVSHGLFSEYIQAGDMRTFLGPFHLSYLYLDVGRFFSKSTLHRRL